MLTNKTSHSSLDLILAALSLFFSLISLLGRWHTGQKFPSYPWQLILGRILLYMCNKIFIDWGLWNLKLLVYYKDTQSTKFWNTGAIFMKTKNRWRSWVTVSISKPLRLYKSAVLPVHAILQLHLDVPSNTAWLACSMRASCDGPTWRANEDLHIEFHMDGCSDSDIDIFQHSIVWTQTVR